MFLLFPYLVDVPMARWPLANWLLILITGIVSIAMFPAVRRWDQRAQAGATYSFNSNGLEAHYHERGHFIDKMMLQPGAFQATQLVGDLFLHEGYLHLLGNMLFLWLFGNAINAKVGHWQFLLLYFGAGIFEGLIYIMFGPHEAALGASGAIMGVMGAFLVLYPHNDVRCFWIFVIWGGFWAFSSMWLLLFYFCWNLWDMIGGQVGGVAYISHVAGFAFGTAVMLALVRKGVVRPTENEETLPQLIARLRPA